MQNTTVVIPCYNEADRLQPESFLSLLKIAPLELIFVNDGSQDDTLELLRKMQEQASEDIQVISLPHNVGKGEAIREGMRQAIDDGAQITGFLDSDLSTPIEEVPRLLKALESSHISVVMGARVALLGRQIDRHPERHYLGRVFATIASLLLGIRVYDTQCGAKFFRRSRALEEALSRPFVSRWAFDVELIGRLLYTSSTPLDCQAFLEVPLQRWSDVSGSKLTPSHIMRAGFDVVRIAVDLLPARRRADQRG
jgi:glycosyltransferase involved in cell wall biosynthesis